MDLNILLLVPTADFIHSIEKTGKVCPLGNKIVTAPSTFTQFVLGNVIFMAYVLTPVFPATFYPGEWTLIPGLFTAAIIPSPRF